MLRDYCKELGHPPIDPTVFSLAMGIFFDLLETIEVTAVVSNDLIVKLLDEAKAEIKRKVC
jgi:hypothetical protein